MLALLPGISLPSETALEYRCGWWAACGLHPQSVPAWQAAACRHALPCPLSATCCRNKLLQLVRLAGRLGRLLLLPDPICNATWVRWEGWAGWDLVCLGRAALHYGLPACLCHAGCPDERHWPPRRAAGVQLGFGEQQEQAPPGHRKSFLDIEAVSLASFPPFLHWPRAAGQSVEAQTVCMLVPCMHPP